MPGSFQQVGSFSGKGTFLGLGAFQGGLDIRQVITALFAGASSGAVYDVSQKSSLFQDSAGTVPVLNDGDPVGYIADLSGNGKNATQSVSGNRPTYRSSGGQSWLEFDGVDDRLSSASTNATIFSLIVAAAADFNPLIANAATQIMAGARASATTTGTQLGLNISGIATGRAGLTTNMAAGVDIRGSKTVLAVTSDNINASLFRDASQIATQTTSGHSITIPIMIGAYNSNGTAASFYKGRFYGGIIVEGKVSSADGLALAGSYFGYDRYPSRTATLPQTSAILLPDGAGGSTAGKGFTCTGLSAKADGTWWLGNHGKALAADATSFPSVVHLSADFTTILGEIPLASLGLAATSVQGVCYDNSDDTIWAVCPDNIGAGTNSVIAHIDPAGPTLLGSWTTPQNTEGVTIDHYGMLLIAVPGGITRRLKSAPGTTVGPAVTITGGQLFADGTRLFVAGGTNGQNGTVTIRDNTRASLPVISVITLEGYDSAEGAVLRNGNLYVCNDSYYHVGVPPLNRVLIYDGSIFA